MYEELCTKPELFIFDCFKHATVDCYVSDRDANFLPLKNRQDVIISKRYMKHYYEKNQVEMKILSSIFGLKK